MIFRRRKPTVPELPTIDTGAMEQANAEADAELHAAKKQAFQARMIANSARQTRIRNHFAPAVQAQFRPKGT